MPSTDWKKYINVPVTSINAAKIAQAISEAPMKQEEKETNSLGEICLSLGIHYVTITEDYIKAFEQLISAKSFLNSKNIKLDWAKVYIAHCCSYLNNKAMGLFYSEEIIKKYSQANKKDREIGRLVALAHFARAFSSIEYSHVIEDFLIAIELYENIAASDPNVLDNQYADIKLNYANYLANLENPNLPDAVDIVELYKNKKNGYEELKSTNHENPALVFENFEKNYWSKKDTSHSYHAERFHFYYGEYLYKKSQYPKNTNSTADRAAALVQFEKAKAIDDNLKKDTGKGSKLSQSIQNKVAELKAKLKGEKNTVSKQHSRSLTLSSEKPLGFLLNRNRSNSVTSYGSCDTTPRKDNENKSSTVQLEFNPFKNS